MTNGSAPLAAAGLATAAERHHALLPVLVRILRLLFKLSAAALGKVAVVEGTVAIAPPASLVPIVPTAPATAAAASAPPAAVVVVAAPVVVVWLVVDLSFGARL